MVYDIGWIPHDRIIMIWQEPQKRFHADVNPHDTQYLLVRTSIFLINSTPYTIPKKCPLNPIFIGCRTPPCQGQQQWQLVQGFSNLSLQSPQLQPQVGKTSRFFQVCWEKVAAFCRKPIFIFIFNTCFAGYDFGCFTLKLSDLRSVVAGIFLGSLSPALNQVWVTTNHLWNRVLVHNTE